MNKNQNGFGVIGIVIIVVVLALISLAGWRVFQTNDNTTTQLDSNAKPTNADATNTIETKRFSVYSPEGVRNDSKSDSGSVSYNTDLTFGRIDVDVYTSSLDVSHQRYNVQVTKIMRNIADQNIEVDEINYASAIRGTSSKHLLRYGFKTRNLTIQGSDKKAIVSIEVLSKKDLTASDLREFKDMSDKIMDSIKIKPVSQEV